jgi:16S rRNA G966 N2-methylase RsmD/transposase-like protein
MATGLTIAQRKNKGPISDGFEALYRKPLPSTRTGALYNAFSYPTKISPEAIALFIATHTDPGSTTLDVFGGSGTTGIAALLCDKPTDAMVQTANQLGLKPKWGPRRAVLYELGVLGSFVSKAICSSPEPEQFELAALKLVQQAEQELGWLWDVKDPKGNRGRLRHAIWSDVLICPHCKAEASFWRLAVRRNPLRLGDRFTCPSCRKKSRVADVERAMETVFDGLLGKPVTRKKRVLVRIYGQTDGKTWQRDAAAVDAEAVVRAEQTSLPTGTPMAEIAWGDLYRSGYHKGISHLHHFYTSRNFLAIAKLWSMIEQHPESIRDALKLLVLSYNATHSTLMTRVVVKDGQNDFILTGAQSGVLYVSSLPVEKNVFEGVRRKIATFKQAFEAIAGSRSTVEVMNASSTKLGLSDMSIDYAFTDPPFGGYIPYAELNQLNELWLGRTTDQKEEVIVSSAQNKSVDTYARLMGEVFSEMARVLKDKGKATVVFHSAKTAVWHALMQAYEEAGFRVQTTSILDKLQTSFKQVVSNVSVKGDPLILLAKDRKLEKTRMRADSDDGIFQEILRRAHNERDPQEREPTRLYSRFVSRCLELGVHVSYDAEDFYHRVKATELVA